MPRACYELVARVVRTRGLEGKVTATAAANLPFRVATGLCVHVVPPALDAPRELEVTQVEPYSADSYLLAFQGVDDIETAEKLAGRYLLACTDDLVDDDYADEQWMLGMRVVDEGYGELGDITELICTPANDVWVVQGPYGEVLIPVLDETVLAVPETQDKPIRTRIMKGLIEQ